MRLEPVFLVAPRPKPPSIPTRRAFLMAGCAFAAGSIVGGACGYTIGAMGRGSDVGSASAGPAEIELKPTGDADLDELQRLAVKAPIDELWEKANLFLGTRSFSYRDDAILYRGVERLALEVLGNSSRKTDPVVVSAIISAIEKGLPPAELNLSVLVPKLQAKREALRQGK